MDDRRFVVTFAYSENGDVTASTPHPDGGGDVFLIRVGSEPIPDNWERMAVCQLFEYLGVHIPPSIAMAEAAEVCNG